MSWDDWGGFYDHLVLHPEDEVDAEPEHERVFVPKPGKSYQVRSCQSRLARTRRLRATLVVDE